MPALSDLFNITPGAISTAPQRMRNLPPAPVKPEYDQMIEDFRRSFEQQ